MSSKPVTLRIGTRGSRLALWQASWVADSLKALFQEISVECVIIQSSGDKQPSIPLTEVGNKGFFTDEIEAALLEGRIDVAVHSLKDLPCELPQGLEIAAYCKREDARDVLISKDNCPLLDLPPGSQIGTSSLRRTAQIKHLRPDLQCVPLRGNVDTRLRKLEESPTLSALVLAAAGVLRMGLKDRISQYLSEDEFLPAPGQGVIALEVSSRRTDVKACVAALNHPQSEAEAKAERTFLNVLEGGCQLPVGARAYATHDSLELRGLVACLDGSAVVRVHEEGGNPQDVGRRAAEHALAQGASDILEALLSERGGLGS